VNDESASDEQLILLPDGTGVFVEYDFNLCGVSDILWRLDGHNLSATYAHSKLPLISGDKIEYAENVAMGGLGGSAYTGDCFEADNWNFYRMSSIDTTADELIVLIDELKNR